MSAGAKTAIEWLGAALRLLDETQQFPIDEALASLIHDAAGAIEEAMDILDAREAA